MEEEDWQQSVDPYWETMIQIRSLCMVMNFRNMWLCLQLHKRFHHAKWSNHRSEQSIRGVGQSSVSDSPLQEPSYLTAGQILATSPCSVQRGNYTPHSKCLHGKESYTVWLLQGLTSPKYQFTGAHKMFIMVPIFSGYISEASLYSCMELTRFLVLVLLAECNFSQWQKLKPFCSNYTVSWQKSMEHFNQHNQCFEIGVPCLHCFRHMPNAYFYMYIQSLLRI